MEWVLLVVAVGVLAVGAVAAAGRLGGMAEEPVRDAHAPALPAGPWSGRDVRGLRFGTALRGYQMAQVDEALARLAGELDRRDVQITELQDALATRVPPPPPAAPAPEDADQPWR